MRTIENWKMKELDTGRLRSNMRLSAPVTGRPIQNRAVYLSILLSGLTSLYLLGSGVCQKRITEQLSSRLIGASHLICKGIVLVLEVPLASEPVCITVCH